MRSAPSALVRVTPSGVEQERGAPTRDELRDAAQRVGLLERALELGFDDGVDLPWLVAAGVADALLAVGVGPAGAVGDHVVVVAGDQVASVRRDRKNSNAPSEEIPVTTSTLAHFSSHRHASRRLAPRVPGPARRDRGDRGRRRQPTYVFGLPAVLAGTSTRSADAHDRHEPSRFT
jgi:hypothetical protein